MKYLNLKTIISCIVIISINDIISIYISTIYYNRLLMFIILYLLFDIFRIYHDYLDVSKELLIITKNINLDKTILEEIKYNNMLITSSIMVRLISIENKLNKLKKI
jgi:hypothetical protein